MDGKSGCRAIRGVVRHVISHKPKRFRKCFSSQEAKTDSYCLRDRQQRRILLE